MRDEANIEAGCGIREVLNLKAETHTRLGDTTCCNCSPCEAWLNFLETIEDKKGNHERTDLGRAVVLQFLGPSTRIRYR